MRKKLCVIIPVYKNNLSPNEKKSIETTIRKMKDADVFFVTYKGVHNQLYAEYKTAYWEFFDKEFFEDTRGYNRLMLSPSFYLRFKRYKYMLIVQTDAMILRNQKYLHQIMKGKYDYWGAPWENGIEVRRFHFQTQYEILNCYSDLKVWLEGKESLCYVGNGGLSLRRIDKTILLLMIKRLYAHTWQRNEDAFFAYHGKHNMIGYRVASLEHARDFSAETETREIIEQGKIPFGVHAWEKYYPEILTLINKRRMEEGES